MYNTRSKGLWPCAKSMLTEDFRLATAFDADFDANGYSLYKSFLTPEALAFLRNRADEIYSCVHPKVHYEWVYSLHQLFHMHSANRSRTIGDVQQFRSGQMMTQMTTNWLWCVKWVLRCWR